MEFKIKYSGKKENLKFYSKDRFDQLPKIIKINY